MVAKVKYSTNLAATGLYFEVTNDADEYLNSSTGLFEAWDGAHVAAYRTTLTLVPNSNGIFTGTVPAISALYLPHTVNIFIYDSATAIDAGPIGQGRMRIDKQNNEISVEQLTSYIFASTVGNNQGVGTDTEHYFSFDTYEAFRTTFDSNGNRFTVELLQELP